MNRCWTILAAVALAAGCASDPAPAPSTDPPAANVQTVAFEADGFGSGRTFFGTPLGEARSVIFISDCSGSMTCSLDFVKYELKRCLGTLCSQDKFDVLFMSSGPPVEMPPHFFVAPTEDNKRMAYEFIDSVVPTGETSPEDSLRRAFELKPDAIFLLTDGVFDRSTVDFVKHLEAGHKCPVHAFCFLYKTGEPILKEIAGSTGGTYRFIAESDLVELTQQPAAEDPFDPSDPIDPFCDP